MPVIPTYEESVGLDPGNTGQVALDKSQATAAGNLGAALEKVGSTVTDFAEHQQKRDEQKEKFAASIGLQSAAEAISAGDAKAQNGMAPDGSGWATSRTQAAQGIMSGFLSSLPASQQEHFGLQAGLMMQKYGDAYAEQEAKAQGLYYTNVFKQENVKQVNGVAQNPSDDNLNAAWETQRARIEALPIAPDQKQVMLFQAQQDLARATLTARADAPARAAAAAKLGVMGPDGAYATPPAGGAVQQQQKADAAAATPATGTTPVAYVPVDAKAGGQAPSVDQQYAGIPDVDGRGQAGQKDKFVGWNSNPVANDPEKFAQLDPRMQAIVAQARKDNPDLRFVIGSGKRVQADEDKAASYGWSPAAYSTKGSLAAYSKQFAPAESAHLTGRAADIWAIDDKGAVTFDPGAQDKVAVAMKAAAAKLGISMDAGADFKHPDRPHFEVPKQDAAAQQPNAAQGAAPAQMQPAVAADGTPMPVPRPAGLNGQDAGATVQPAVVGGPGAAAAAQGAPARPVGNLTANTSDADAVRWGAAQLGTSPDALAMAISYESGFRPGIWGGKGGRYLGLIQFGPEEQQHYGVTGKESFAEQMPKVVAFLKDRGFKPGMSLLDLYSTINAGSPGHYNASDGNGTVAGHVEAMQAMHGDRVAKFLGQNGITPGSLGGNGPSGGLPPHFSAAMDDPRFAIIPWEQRRAIELDAMRGAEAYQSQQNAQVKAQHDDYMNTVALAANDGKYGLTDLARDRQPGGPISQYPDVKKIQDIIASKQKGDDDLGDFNRALATPGFQFNPVDKDHQKMVDAGYKAMAGASGASAIDAAQRIVERTGIVPSEAGVAMRGAVISGDPTRAQSALSVAANMLRVNPNILDAMPGGEKLAKQASTYQHFTNDMGMTPQAATQRVVDQETPEFKRKLALELKGQSLNDVAKQNTSPADLEAAFNVGLPYFGRPSVAGQTFTVQRELLGDYEDWFKEHYKDSGDASQAKALALADVKKVWGVTGVTGAQVFTRYPAEQAPAYAGIDDIGGKIAEAARTAIKTGTGQDVPRDKLRITATGDTPDAWRAGKAPPYALSWEDANGIHQFAPQPLVVDPGAIRFQQNVARAHDFGQRYQQRIDARQDAPDQMQGP